MEQARYTFNFCIKKSRSRADGMAPIYLRVTVDCDRKEKASNLFVEPTQWDARFGLSRGTDKYSTSLNSRLSVIRSKMLEAYTALSSLGELPSAEAVINKFLGVETRKKEQHFLLDLFRDHNEKCAKLAANNQMADGTVERYVTSYKHTRDFIRQRYGLDDIEICMIDRNFIDDYEFYLKTKPTPCSHNSTVKYLKNFHKIVRLAVRLKYIAEDPFMHKQLKLEEVHPEFLEEHELAAILKKEFRTRRLSQVRDVFVFCCFTGLAFSDVKQLSQSHICEDHDALAWIRKRREKTKMMCNVPILDQAMTILHKYRDEERGGYLLPVLTNQKMNEYLKEIAELCGIDKDISTHTGRHTFATMALNNGVALHNVAKMLGHSSINMTRRYARVLDRSIKKEMEGLQGALANLTFV